MTSRISSFPKSLPINERLHKIFNGAIDLIFPTIINKLQIKNLIPIFVSTDKRISKLNSLMGIRARFNTNETYSYSPELIQADFLGRLKWTKEEMDQLYVVPQSDINRLNRFDGRPRMTTHLLKYVKPLETVLIKLWQNA